MAKQINAMKPADVETPPPWERVEVHFTEIPAVIKRWYGRTFKEDTIYSWTRKGKRSQDGKRVKLQTKKIGGLLYVEVAHLRNFLEAT